ncbi:MAG: methionyl-tRNA formyltransferase, partial [Oscillospiraceae bacterium]|nr:methionyl-tRNA formyltransferase [Oscillospiraceae bacterium]
MRVVFMGTPDIAATCLKKILADDFQVVGVYTQPDRPKGRGMKLVASPVKEVALANEIPVFQPENFREEETVEQLRALQPDAVAVVAYGRILPQAVLDIAPNRFINIHASVLPQSVLDIPAKGCINIHASVLPAYRGSAPYQWAVLDGLTETGVTAQHMVREMDAGDVIDVARTPIGENETAGEVLDRLAVLGAELLSKVL